MSSLNTGLIARDRAASIKLLREQFFISGLNDTSVQRFDTKSGVVTESAFRALSCLNN